MGAPEKEKVPVPQWVGRYEVLVPIASGGMATVYLARSRGAQGFQRDVALKLTHRHLKETPEFHQVLVEEAKLASSIRHHNVVAVLDVGDDTEGLFLVMEYVEGDTLSGLVRRAQSAHETLPRPIGLRILFDALAGLHAAHETRDAKGEPLSIVHRDFSPHNVLVGTDGVARLTDFGIAKAASRSGNTATGIIKGKAAYMAPEQARGLAIDRRCDVWAAGVVAWEIFAGRPLWARNTDDIAVLIKLVTESPARLATVAPDLAPEIDEVIMRALELDVDKRWPSAAAFAKALQSAWEKSGGVVADAEQVAEHVAKSVGAKLEQRRAQVAVVEKLRSQLGDVAETTMATPSGIASIPDVPAPLVASLPLSEPIVQDDHTIIQVDPPMPMPIAMVAHEAPTTDTTSSSDALAIPTRAFPRWPIVAGVAGALALVATIVIVVSSKSSDEPAAIKPAQTETVAPTQTQTLQIPTQAQLSASPPPTTSARAPTQTPTVVATHHASITTFTATATARTAAPTATKLAPSPY